MNSLIILTFKIKNVLNIISSYGDIILPIRGTKLMKRCTSNQNQIS